MRIPSLGFSTHNCVNDSIGSRTSSSLPTPSSASSSLYSSHSLLCRLLPSSSSSSSSSSNNHNLHYDSIGHHSLIASTGLSSTSINNNINNHNHNINNENGDSIQVVFSAQSRDAIIYVTVVLVIYIIIFVVLVVTSYRKSSALRETLNRHLRSQYATGPFGTPTILETDSNGDQVHCDTVDELHEGSIQL